MPPPRLALLSALMALAAGTGCGATGTTFVCDPACPAGYSCAAGGCVGSAGVVDLGMTTPEDGAAQCAGACPAATPYCNPAQVCVACLSDAQCPRGSICQTLGVGAACTVGCRDSATCASDGGAPLCCSGQCVDTSADVGNCGDCGHSCALHDATAACVAGACTIAACQAGWADCNVDPTDGCEVNLMVDHDHCGNCDGRCALAHATAGCSLDGCYIAACDFGWDDCDALASSGCETSVIADLRNCGQCGHSCAPAAHATIACQYAQCGIAACSDGYGDCDGMVASGCETAIATDLKNCGACGNACGPKQVCTNSGCTCQKCSLPHARTRCVNLVCVFDQCLAGFGDCNGDLTDGCETDVTGNPGNCGRCGVACGGKTPYCEAGVCSDTSPSCNDVLKGNPNAQDGTYTVDPDGNGPVQPYVVWCDMTTDGGGWTAFFVGVNGSPSVFAHFEDVDVSCANPATQCLRRLPASVTTANQFLATCGDAAVRFTIGQPTLTYFATGAQGGGWMPNADQVAVGGGADVQVATNTWTGQGPNKGWIVSANSGGFNRTFSCSYNLNNSWDYCNGAADVNSPIMLLYR